MGKESRMPELNNVSYDNGQPPGLYCPLIKDPAPDCYCVEMNNSKINLVMRYCSGDYKQCDIYKRVFQQTV
jgi:hypothetical protein